MAVVVVAVDAGRTAFNALRRIKPIKKVCFGTPFFLLITKA
jgi:hypothetical protein